MPVTEKVVYVTDDGKEFEGKAKAEEHQNQLTVAPHARRFAEEYAAKRKGGERLVTQTTRAVVAWEAWKAVEEFDAFCASAAKEEL